MAISLITLKLLSFQSEIYTITGEIVYTITGEIVFPTCLSSLTVARVSVAGCHKHRALLSLPFVCEQRQLSSDVAKSTWRPRYLFSKKGENDGSRGGRQLLTKTLNKPTEPKTGILAVTDTNRIDMTMMDRRRVKLAVEGSYYVWIGTSNDMSERNQEVLL